MDRLYYMIVCEGEPRTFGPFETEGERDAECAAFLACSEGRYSDDCGDELFYVDVGANGKMDVEPLSFMDVYVDDEDLVEEHGIYV